MKAQRNAANQLARECLVTALIHLLKTKKISEITITELTNVAGVSRMTFYRNYTTKEDIFIQNMNDIFLMYRQEYEAREQNLEYYDMPNMLHCFRYFSIHKEFLDTLFASGMGNLFLKELSEYILSVWYHDGDGETRYYTLHAFAGSLYNVFFSWSASETSISEGELSSIIHAIYSKTEKV